MGLGAGRGGEWWSRQVLVWPILCALSLSLCFCKINMFLLTGHLQFISNVLFHMECFIFNCRLSSLRDFLHSIEDLYLSSWDYSHGMLLYPLKYSDVWATCCHVFVHFPHLIMFTIFGCLLIYRCILVQNILHFRECVGPSGDWVLCRR